MVDASRWPVFDLCGCWGVCEFGKNNGANRSYWIRRGIWSMLKV